MKRRLLHRDWLFSAVVAAICVALGFVSLAPESGQISGNHCRGLVIEADNRHVRVNLIVKTDHQVLAVELLDGPHAGETISINNTLSGKLEMDEFYEAGDHVLVEYDVKDGVPQNGTARGHYRLHLEFALIAAFGLLLLMVAGRTGLKAILSFVFAAMVLWKIFFPLLLRGAPPIQTGLSVVAVMTAVITFMVGGLNRRGLATFTGAMAGVLLTCGLAVWFSHTFRLHGAVRPFSEALLYSGYVTLSLTDIFIASVFIASSGAVMDLAMDIAASMDEIHEKQPDISLVEHIHSGLRVGQAVIGTMTTTLLLAYSSSHITMFMLFMAKGLPLENVLNAPFVAAEILNVLVGSFGLVTVAPFTAVVSGLLYKVRLSGTGG